MHWEMGEWEEGREEEQVERTQEGSFQGNQEAYQRSPNQKFPVWGSELTTPPAHLTLCILGPVYNILLG